MRLNDWVLEFGKMEIKNQQQKQERSLTLTSAPLVKQDSPWNLKAFITEIKPMN